MRQSSEATYAASQRAMSAAQDYLAEVYKTTKEAAEAHNTNALYVGWAKTVLESGIQALQEMVRRGELPVKDVARIAKLPKADQLEAVESQASARPVSQRQDESPTVTTAESEVSAQPPPVEADATPTGEESRTDTLGTAPTQESVPESEPEQSVTTVSPDTITMAQGEANSHPKEVRELPLSRPAEVF
jgi:hypothetical protein